MGRETALFASDEPDDEALAMCVRHAIPGIGAYYFCPRGPQADSEYSLEKIIDQIRGEAKQRQLIFLRCEPNLPPSLESGAMRPVQSVHPSLTRIIDLHSSFEHIEKTFKPKTRYNIRLAQKHGVSIRKSNSSKDISRFIELIQLTAHRHKIHCFSPEYYKTMITLLWSDDLSKKARAQCQLLLADFQGAVIAGILLIRFGDTVTYVHGGSDHKFRRLMAPHLLHWHAIAQAQTIGASWYDFWGSAQDSDSDFHPWQGISRFKAGFGGALQKYPGTFEMPFRPVCYRLFRFIRKYYGN